MSFKPGDRVLLETIYDEIFEGILEYKPAKLIELHSILCQNTTSVYEGSMTFYRNEVRNVRIITDTPDSEGPSETSPGKIKMPRAEFDRLKEMTYSFLFVDTLNKRFDDAVEVLNNRESIAVVGLGSNTKHTPLSLLVMADFKQVFIFDLFCLTDLKGVRDILESTYICKVVHGGAALNDCLYHKYKIEMKNVFDTQIVDSMLSKQENDVGVKRSMGECLTHYFNFPLVMLSAADDVTAKTWSERPVIKSDKIKASQLVTYLLSFRDLLMASILKNYTDTTQNEYTTHRNITNSEFFKLKNN